MKKSSVKVTRYTSGKFYVDIVEGRKTWEAWLQHNRYGVSKLMFGIPKCDADYDLFLMIVEANLPEYKSAYKFDYLYEEFME